FGCRLEIVDVVDQVVLVRADQVDARVGQASRVEQQRIQVLGVVGDRGAGCVQRVQRGQDVLRSTAIGVAESTQSLEILADGFTARIDLLQHVVGGSDCVTDLLALSTKPVGQGCQDRVQLGRIDLVQ